MIAYVRLGLKIICGNEEVKIVGGVTKKRFSLTFKMAENL